MPLRLVLAPHMDDESMGCGGLLAKYPEDSCVVTMTDSGVRRSAEHDRAMATLGVTKWRNLGFPDGELPGLVTQTVSALDAVLAEVRPQELYLPFPSLHQDHIATYEAGMRAARISMSSNHWFPPAVYVYDIAAYDVNLYPTDLRWNIFEELSEEQVNAKQAACMCYESEVPSDVHPITSVREMAAAVGRPRLLKYAEQYALVRRVRR
ncbi:MAG: PIG-L family deacetylase [Propionibacteriaceae bacterium]|nr:PIG-L family deacetylase [Micropruina sp.]